ncbi:hypothetical protein BGZ63DRAFT_405855 [Mariannaea sp. PMI_226]|nr:hypothetical protein BGZ63DRAFT_405855 [Mariannaea sp. PMI_226]
MAWLFWYNSSESRRLESQFRKNTDLLSKFAMYVFDARFTAMVNDYTNLEMNLGLEVSMIMASIAQEKNWRLVMDNFDDVSVNLEECIPTGSDGRGIFISRDRRSVDALKPHGEIRLKSTTT